MSLEQQDIKQACFCYKKAIESDPTNVKLVSILDLKYKNEQVKKK